jgi:hypothetical protein
LPHKRHRLTQNLEFKVVIRNAEITLVSISRSKHALPGLKASKGHRESSELPEEMTLENSDVLGSSPWSRGDSSQGPARQCCPRHPKAPIYLLPTVGRYVTLRYSRVIG